MTNQLREVLVERVDRVLVVTINRPEQRNAMTASTSQMIADAVDELDTDPMLSVGILGGNGGNFCTGMDLKRFLVGERAHVPGRGFGGLVESPPIKPLIAAVEGFALAGGFELVLACDLVVAGTSAQFGLPEVRRGLVARAGGLLRLPERIPRAIALELILTGKMISAQRAVALGLVNRIVSDGGAFAGALELAHAIAANAPLAVAISKRIVDESDGWSSGERFARQAALAEPVFRSEDAVEGARAFAEKRAPVWTGR